MEELKSRQDVVERAAKDPEFLNSILTGSFQKEESEQENPQENEEYNDSVENEEPTVETSDEPEEIVNEDEKQRRYIEWKEQEINKEKERVLNQERNYMEMVEKEKKARQDLEKKLEELQKRINESPSPANQNVEDDEEDDPYASEYSKQTRHMVKELTKAIDTVKTGEVGELKEELLRLKKIEENRVKEYEEEKQKQENEFRQKKLVEELNSFASRHPEIKPSDSIDKLTKDWMSFRKNILNLTNATSQAELENYIDDYVNGGKTKDLADKHGIPFVNDYDKLMAIYDLLDMKRGIKYNKTTGKEEVILDDEGKPVRYRNIDEAYKLSKYYDEMNKARINSFKDVQNKLNQRRQSAVTLDNEETAGFSTGISKEQISELLALNPKQYKNNPELRKKVEAVYRMYGQTPPRI